MTLRTTLNSLLILSLLAIGSATGNTVLGGTVNIKTYGGSSVTTLSVANSTSVTDLFLSQSGTAPNGNSWSSYVTGSTAVMYMDTSTGTMIFDPKGLNVTGFQVNWGASSVTSGSAGPFVYTSGSGNAAIGTLLPAGSYAATPTTWQARFGFGITGANLATSGTSVGSTNGYFNLPWSLGAVAPTVTTESLVYSATAGQGFRALAAGGNLLGSGTGVGMFYYTAFGSVGNQYAPVIAVTSVQAVPEPSTIVLAGLGVAAVGFAQVRRQRKKAAAAISA